MWECAEMESDALRGPTPLNNSDVFYRRIVFDMMMASQYNQTRMLHTSPLSAEDIMDNTYETCSQDGPTKEYYGRNWWAPYCNVETDTENPQSTVPRMDRTYQQQMKTHTPSHHLFKKAQFNTFAQPITHQANLHSPGRDETLSCQGTPGTPPWTDEYHNKSSTNSEEFVIDHQTHSGHRRDLCKVEVGLPYWVPQHPTLQMKEEPSFTDLAKPTKQETITTTSREAECSPSLMLSEPLEISPKDRSVTKSTQGFEFDWGTLGSMESLGSNPPFADTTMQSTAALKNIDGWADRDYRLGGRAWADMNDLTNLMMTQRNPPADLLENMDQFQSSYDSQCSPVSSFSSNGLTPDPITLAPQEVEYSPPELPQPYRPQQPTMLQVGRASDRYMQAGCSAEIISRAGCGSSGIQKKSKSKLARQRNNAKDAFLVRSKRAGMSYKEIKEKGRFVEAESTLRGRFRTLTKRKELRVRKPEWKSRDLQLLCEAVARYTKPIEQTRKAHSFQELEGSLNADFKSPRIPWKLVGEYIWNNGGSYHFGNATCKKKWEELREINSFMKVKDIQ